MTQSTGMQRPEPLSRRLGARRVILLTLGLAAAALAASAVARTDSLVERGFAEALQSPGATEAGKGRSRSVPIAGSEDFWLSQSASAHGVPTGGEVSLALWPSKVRLGTPVDISLGGRSVSFEVVEIVSLPAGITRVSTAESGHDLVMVSLREAGKPDGAALRFIVEADQTGAGEVTVLPQRSL